MLNSAGTAVPPSKIARVSMGPARVATAPMPPSRASVGVFGASAGGAGASSGAPQARVSLAGGGTTAHRRSSAGIRGSKDDPRPIMTPGFLRENCDVLVSFLLEHSYDRDISLKLLKSPTATEFENIFCFLAKWFDPGFRIRDKVTNDVPELLKMIKFVGAPGVGARLARYHRACVCRYPVSLSKTALVAVGTQHNWPNCLAALTWMIELINVRAPSVD